MPSAGNPRVHIRLNRDLLSQLRERGADVSATCRRIVEEHLAGPKPKPKRAPRAVPKPERLRRIIAEVETLMVNYQTWLDNLPENLQDGDFSERLQETVDRFEEARDVLESIEPPKGFGRD